MRLKRSCVLLKTAYGLYRSAIYAIALYAVFFTRLKTGSKMRVASQKGLIKYSVQMRSAESNRAFQIEKTTLFFRSFKCVWNMQALFRFYRLSFRHCKHADALRRCSNRTRKALICIFLLMTLNLQTAKRTVEQALRNRTERYRENAVGSDDFTRIPACICSAR